MCTDSDLSEQRRLQYEELQRRRPELFVNPEDAAFRILLQPRDLSRVEQRARSRLFAAGLPPDWGNVGVVYQDEYLVVVRDAVRFPDASEGTYIRVLPACDAVGVVVIPLLDDALVLVRHHRHATRQWHWEVPRGFGENAGSPLSDARRELGEELGVSPENIMALGSMHVDTGLLSNRVEIYCAVLSALGRPGASEGIGSVLVASGQDVSRMIAAGELTDGFTLAAVTMAQAAGVFKLPVGSAETGRGA